MYPLTEQQRLFMVESSQLYAAWREALAQVEAHKYGMRWVRRGEQDYLIRLRDAVGNGKSLGPRSEKTEAIHAAFSEGKARSEVRYRGLNEKLKMQARLNKATRIDRLPGTVSRILRAIDLGKARDDFRVIGTHALFAYEAMAGVQFRAELLASGDVDLLYDPRKKLSIVAGHLDGEGLIGMLKKVDKSFALVDRQRFRAVNDEGFMVDLIVPVQDIRAADVRFAENDFLAVETPGLQWLVNAPAVEVIVIGRDGMPVRARVPDPRAFAVHKAWLAQQSDREPLKKPRDKAQSALLIDALRDYLPQYPFDAGQMRYFPKTVLRGELPA